MFGGSEVMSQETEGSTALQIIKGRMMNQKKMTHLPPKNHKFG